MQSGGRDTELPSDLAQRLAAGIEEVDRVAAELIVVVLDFCPWFEMHAVHHVQGQSCVAMQNCIPRTAATMRQPNTGEMEHIAEKSMPAFRVLR